MIQTLTKQAYTTERFMIILLDVTDASQWNTANKKVLYTYKRGKIYFTFRLQYPKFKTYYCVELFCETEGWTLCLLKQQP